MGMPVEGLREAVRQLEKLGVDVEDLKDTMGRIAAKATEVMQGFIPSRSGKLRASARGNRAKGKAVVTVGRASVRYAAPVNYGYPRRNIRPALFTRKTDEVMDDLAVQMLTDGIDDIINERGLQ